MSDELKTTYVLEMTDKAQMVPKKDAPKELEVRQAEIPCPELSWFMHQAVGSDYRWGGREDWSRDDWQRFVDNPAIETWMAYVQGTPAGYFELRRHEDGATQIVCFGLIRQFIGQGLGGHLLTHALEVAWRNAQRVWLSTCSHDHEYALRNYQARGFQLAEQRVGEPNQTRGSALFGGAE